MAKILVLGLLGIVLTACSSEVQEGQSSAPGDADGEQEASQQSLPLLQACGVSEFESCTSTRWPGGNIYYEFSGAWTDAEKSPVLSAMSEWSQMTGYTVRFTESTTEPDRAVLQGDGSFCNSGLGKKGGTQAVNIKKCNAWSTRHELGHLIGLPHQHKRSDRDRFVALNEQWYCVDSPSGHCTDPAKPFCGYPSLESYRDQLFHDSLIKCQGGAGSDYGVFNLNSVMIYGSGLPSGCTGAGCDLSLRTGGTFAGGATVSLGDASAVVEMYREEEGWSKMKPVYTQDPGPTAPLDFQLAPGVSLVGSPAMAKRNWSVEIVARGSNNHLYRKTKSFWYGFPTGAWEDLGGSIASDPAIVSWGGDNLDVVAVSTTGSIAHRPFRSGQWQAWGSIGRPSSWVIPSAPAIAAWGPDHLDVFVRSGSTLFKKTWSPGWSGWDDLGGNIVGRPSAVSWGVGRIDVVARGADGRLLHKPYSYSTWWGWGNLYSLIQDGTSPTIASGGPDQLDIYMTSANGLLTRKRWRNAWQETENLGGAPSGSPAAVAHSSSSGEVCANLGPGIYCKSR